MNRMLLLGLLMGIVACGDSTASGGGSSGAGGRGGTGGSGGPGGTNGTGELEWEISYSGDRSGTAGGPICTVSGVSGIIAIGCINRQSPESFNATANLALYQTGQVSSVTATMNLSDGTGCVASSTTPPVFNVTTATNDLYVIEISGDMSCDEAMITLDGTIETTR